MLHSQVGLSLAGPTPWSSTPGTRGGGGGRKLLNRVGGRLLGLVRVWVIWVQGFIGVRAEDTWDLSSRFGHVLTWVPSWMGSEKSLV